jgi:hypothetical protein
MARSPAQIVTLHVQLRGIEPAIWRRVRVPADFTLRRVHDVIQATFDWLDYHLHEFNVAGRRYGMPEVEGDDWGAPKLASSKNVRLSKVLEWGVERFVYVYDFGDDWVHDVTVEEVGQPAAGVEYPVLVDGARRAPPEDVGGPPGFFQFVEAMLDECHPDHDRMFAWYGWEPFVPDDIERDLVEVQLERIRAQRRKGPRR